MAFLAGLIAVFLFLVFIFLALPLLAAFLLKLHFGRRAGRPEDRAGAAEDRPPPVIDVAWREVRDGPGKGAPPPGEKPGDC